MCKIFPSMSTQYNFFSLGCHNEPSPNIDFVSNTKSAFRSSEGLKPFKKMTQIKMPRVTNNLFFITNSIFLKILYPIASHKNDQSIPLLLLYYLVLLQNHVLHLNKYAIQRARLRFYI